MQAAVAVRQKRTENVRLMACPTWVGWASVPARSRLGWASVPAWPGALRPLIPPLVPVDHLFNRITFHRPKLALRVAHWNKRRDFLESRQQRRARRMAAPRTVELGVPEATFCERIEIRSLDFSTVASQIGESQVIRKDDQNVWRFRGC
jgi:hypothetical protein